MMTVFVTVGSTSFDDLIKAVCSEDILCLLKAKGFKRIIFQIGRGSIIPDKVFGLKSEWFRYVDNISNYISSASLVIGHAGAGTILETLIAQKPLITVLNENLMNNHQSELAEQMEKEGYLLSCPCSQLYRTLQDYFDSKQLKSYASEITTFPFFLEEIMGFI